MTKKPAIIEQVETLFPPIVHREIARMQAQGGPNDSDKARSQGRLLSEAFERFDVLYHTTALKGDAKTILEEIAFAVAYISFQVGGCTVFGTHYESGIPMR